MFFEKINIPRKENLLTMFLRLCLCHLGRRKGKPHGEIFSHRFFKLYTLLNTHECKH
jgi:hypothetical protein